MRKFCIVFFLFVGTILPNKSFSQNEKFKALFIYNFTKYIEWPADFSTGEFIIGVLGNSPIITELETISDKRKVGNQTIVIQQYNSVGDIRKCHILYLPSGKSASLQEVLQKLAPSTPTLVITDSPGLASKGAAINFVLKGNHQEFEINTAALETSKLKVNNTLLTLGTVVNK
ncbi:MAG TPA: YfiR family protein [Salinivirgaceae bacterium]|nr:YfiR family protein [Salinivirgaceae bacterium]